MKAPKEIFVDSKRCTACKTCEIACAVEHSRCKSLYACLSETPRPRCRLHVQFVSPDKNVPNLCRHCDDAPCMSVCPSGAIIRTDAGVVIVDEEACVSCGACVEECPYEAIWIHPETQKAYKCDRCPGRVVPRCVSTCPTKALIYDDV